MSIGAATLSWAAKAWRKSQRHWRRVGLGVIGGGEGFAESAAAPLGSAQMRSLQT